MAIRLGSLVQALIMTLLALTTSLAILECMALALVTVGFGWLVTHLYTNH